LRTLTWPGIGSVAAGAFLIALFVLDGTSQVVVVAAAVLVFLVAVVRALDGESYRKRDADIPFPPGGGGGPWGF
jgi:membrane protein implicated in regulation of membrane protease activity